MSTYVRENTRFELTRLLHDDVGQTITICRLLLEQLEESTALPVSRFREMLDQTLRRIHDYLEHSDGNSVSQHRVHLVDSAPKDIAAFIDTARTAGAAVWHFENVSSWPIEQDFWCAADVLREGIVNALRHSPGSPIYTELKSGSDGRRLIAEVISERQDTMQISLHHSHQRGLAALADRVSEIGGQLEVEIQPRLFILRFMGPDLAHVRGGGGD